MNTKDHPIFEKSIRHIQAVLGKPNLPPLQQQVLERLIHTTGDFSIQSSLKFSPDACEHAITCLQEGVEILTDTSMAAAAVNPMAKRTLKTQVSSVLEWAPENIGEGLTKTALGMERAWKNFMVNQRTIRPPIVVIGSSPTALETLLDLVNKGASPPSLIVGMPVGFIGVQESKKCLINSENPYIAILGSRGGAAMAAATINALLRASLSSQL